MMRDANVGMNLVEEDVRNIRNKMGKSAQR